MTTWQRTLLACCMLLAAAQTAAQTSHAGRWFQIEVIVFSQNSPGAAERELPLVETLPQPADVQFLRDSGDAARGQVDLTRDPMVLLPHDQQTMNHLARKLEQTYGYQLLYHGAWRQPVMLRQDAQPVYIRGGGQVHEIPELEGVLVPSVDFYLATEVDLRLSEPRAGLDDAARGAPESRDQSDWHQQSSRSEPDIDGLGLRGGFGQTARQPAVATVALQEKRGRMRSTELHYFDHPRLGMLIRYDRYNTPPQVTQDAPDADTATESGESAQPQ